MDGNGWWDIGYNFLIGEDGRIYEGRGFHIQGEFFTFRKDRKIKVPTAPAGTPRHSASQSWAALSPIFQTAELSPPPSS